MKKNYAGVITGDLVGSTEVTESARREGLEAVQQCFAAFTGDSSGEIYRGDAFQLYTTSPEKLIFMALKLRLSLIELGLDARLSMAVAEAEDRELPVRIANNSEAFTLSGRQLDGMKSSRFAFGADEESFSRDVGMMVGFLDDQISQVTAKMAQSLVLWMDNPSLQHAALAEKLGISRSAFTRVINRANYGRVDDALKWYADRIKRYQEL